VLLGATLARVARGKSSRSNMKRPIRLAGCLLMFLAVRREVGAQEPGLGVPQKTDLASMNIEDLMNLQVTTASKTEQKLSQTAAAMYVITQEDIRRSGMSSVAELIRMVPGMDVAQVGSNTWAISSRGFNDRFANKLLVLVDGRAVYTLTYSGVYWEVQDLVLEDIDRVEVIRGPGGLLWGANAVNGVINIITKKAEDTQGALVTLESGNQERSSTTTQFGGRTKNGAYRIFAKYFDREPFANASGGNAADGWDMLHGGFRSDWHLSQRDTLTVQGDLYNGCVGRTITGVISFAPNAPEASSVWTQLDGGNLLGRWRRTLTSTSDVSLQIYYDHYRKFDPVLREHRQMGDLDFQHHFVAYSRHDITWGADFRRTVDHMVGSLALGFRPSRKNDWLFSGFVQDQIGLVRDRLRLNLGMRYEADGLEPPEILPDIRLIWTPKARQALWMAVSRAVRTPSRADADLDVDTAIVPGAGGVPTTIEVDGNPNIGDEYLTAFQAGYRAQYGKYFSAELTGYHNHYNGLRGTSVGTPFVETDPGPPHLVLPHTYNNSIAGGADGVEVSSTWQVASRWKLSGGYTWLRMNLHSTLPGDHSADLAATAGTSPTEQFNLRSYVNLPQNIQFDTMMYFVGGLPTFSVPAYARLDSRIAWRPMEGMELSVTGQNLSQPRHLEFTSANQGILATQVKRSFYGKMTWRY
jgi:iron complex outermembrane receptor protein